MIQIFIVIYGTSAENKYFFFNEKHVTKGMTTNSTINILKNLFIR